MERALDFLAVVSRPDFPSGTGPVGDYYNLRALIDAHPTWNAAVLELNSRRTSVEWDGASMVVKQEGLQPIDVGNVGVALYLPISLEVDETLLSSIDHGGQWPRFDQEQWRPITAAFEDRLTRGRCLNRPDRVRLTNNKLLQFERLMAAGFSLPPSIIANEFPRTRTFSGIDELVSKNVSEGGWKSPTEFSPARIINSHEVTDPWPSIWQQPIRSDRELRFYVMGDVVVTVELDRNPEVLDVRSTNDGKPSARITVAPEAWIQQVLAMTRCLELDYAVIDAIPTREDLHVLEVNANGVWWFLPDEVAAIIEQRFHLWLTQCVEREREDQGR